MKVAIVGGGIIGLSLALELKRRGAHPIVIERGQLGAEASTAAGGMLAPQFEFSKPSPMFELCLKSRQAYRAWAQAIEELSGTSVGYLPSGLLQLAFDATAATALEATVAWQKSQGLRAQLLSPSQASELEPGLSPRLAAAAHYADEHQVDPCKLLPALELAVMRSSVEVRRGLVRSVAIENGRALGVDVEGQNVRADAVVVAAGAWSSLIAQPELPATAVRPAKGQMVELRAPQAPRQMLVTHSKYVIPRGADRVVVGSTLEHVGFDKRVTAAGLFQIIENVLELYPPLADAEVVKSWAGFRPYTEDQWPVLGQTSTAGLFFATGHFRNGILLAPLTAELMSQQVLGQTTTCDLTPFAPRRLAGTD